VIQRGVRQAPISIGGPPWHPGQLDNVPPLTGSPFHARFMISRVVFESAEPVIVIVAIVARRAAAKPVHTAHGDILDVARQVQILWTGSVQIARHSRMGTSTTMSSQENDTERAVAVARRNFP
jgi:hypothetical protein